MYIDFKALKARVSVEEVGELLDLKLIQNSDATQWRGSCPRCNEGDDRALAITPGKGYYCFSAKAGGDCIALAAHILDRPMKEAALYISEHVDERPEEKAEVAEVAERSMADEAPLQPLSYLHHEHEAVQALGIDADTAEALGIGYAKKGIMRGRVAIPIREEDGTLVGYCGYATDADPPLKLPRQLRVS